MSDDVGVKGGIVLEEESCFFRSGGIFRHVSSADRVDREVAEMLVL